MSSLVLNFLTEYLRTGREARLAEKSPETKFVLGIALTGAALSLPVARRA